MQSLWMLVASLLFACMGVCVKLAAETHSAVEITFYRSFISLILMFGLVRLRGVRLATPHWRWQVSRGVVGFSALFAYFYAITLLPLATAVTLNYTSAIFLAIYLALAGMRMRGGILGALVVGLRRRGLAAQADPACRSTGRRPDRPRFRACWPAWPISACANSAPVASRKCARCSIFRWFPRSAPALWLLFSELHAVDLRSGLLLLGVASFATVAQLAMTRAYTRGKTLLSAALAYSTVIFSSLFGVLFWGEVLDASAWFAIGLIILSGIAATHFSRASPVEQD